MTDAIKTTPTLAMRRSHREDILAIARRHHACNVRVFGSVARGDATSDSDIDLIVNFETGASLYDLSGLRIDLEQFLACTVHIAEDFSDQRPSFMQRIAPDLVVL